MTYKMKMTYQRTASAESYFTKRFSHPRGKRENEETMLALVQALNSIPGMKVVLDMPCGSGRLTQYFYERGYLYIGADISMEMMKVLVKEQKEKGTSPILVHCDGADLPFRDNAFDCVVCFRFFNVQRIPNVVRQEILKEVRRVSGKWLILQGKDLKLQGPFVRFKVFLRKLFGGDTAKYDFEKELFEAGWQEEKRVWIRTINRYIGVYQKAAQAGTGK